MTEDQFDTLARMVKDGFDEFRGEMQIFKAEVSEQFAQVHAELRSIRDELRSVDRRLTALEDAVKDMRGYAKEIDELRSRMMAIEEHLGIAQRIAA